MTIPTAKLPDIFDSRNYVIQYAAGGIERGSEEAAAAIERVRQRYAGQAGPKPPPARQTKTSPAPRLMRKKRYCMVDGCELEIDVRAKRCHAHAKQADSENRRLSKLRAKERKQGT